MEESSPKGMWVRYALFVLLSFAILIGNFALTAYLRRNQPAREEAAEEGGARKTETAKKSATPEKKTESPSKTVAAAPEAKTNAGNPPSAKPPAAAGKKPVAQPPAEVVPTELVTLGSADPDSPYQMLVTLTNQGAAVMRVELNNPRFHDLEDRAGYLGHVVLDEAAGAPAHKVMVVGEGTPAATAGLKPGDLIKAIDGHPVANFPSLPDALKHSKPNDKIKLLVLRGKEELTLEPTLAHKPLELIRPENGDPLSFLMTLAQVGDQEGETLKQTAEESTAKSPIPPPVVAQELEGVDLRSANWQVVKPYTRDKVAFHRLLPALGLEVTKTFELAQVPEGIAHDAISKSYHLVLSIEIHNTGHDERKIAYQIDGPTGLPIEGWWYVQTGLRDVAVAFDPAKPRTLSCTEIANGKFAPEDASSPIYYAGVDAQYFAALLMPHVQAGDKPWFSKWQPLWVGKPAPPPMWSGNPESVPPRLTNTTIRLVTDTEPLASNKSLTHTYDIFAGPKKPHLLELYGAENLVTYGWFPWVAKPMLWVLHHFYAIVHNYGIAIILLTVLVRSCLFPLSRKQALNAQKMQELQPEIKKIQEKYKDNLEARGRAQQELFKKHHYHPLSGCLPVFLQLPIFIGLYNSLRVDVELRQAPLISEAIRWCSNLAAPDMLFNWSSFWIAIGFPSVNNATGYLPLGPFFNVLPIITVLLFLWQQKKFMPPPADEQTRVQMKVMQGMMVLMAVMFYKVAAGLCIYFIASSLWSIAERKYLPKAAAAGGQVAPSTKSSPRFWSKREETPADRKKRRSRRK
jgi:YidC/Oxa1 family membrane protein insertase